MVTTVNPASLMVSWQPPPVIDHNGPLTGHMIQYTRVGSSDIMNDVVTSGTTHTTISGVVAYSNYSIRVAPVNDQGAGPFSNPVVQVSGEDGKFYYMAPKSHCVCACACACVYVCVCRYIHKN